MCGATREERDERLSMALAVAEAEELTLNAEKCIFAQYESDFWCVKISSTDIEPNPDLVVCVVHHPTPTT